MDNKSLIALLAGLGTAAGVAIYAIPKLIPSGGNGGGNQEPSPPPITGGFSAKIISSLTSALVNTPIDFTAQINGGQGPYSVTWSFGDGKVDSGESVTHVYTIPGTFLITCTILDVMNRRLQVYQYVAIGSNNVPQPPPPPPPTQTDVILGFSISPTSGQAPISVSGNVSVTDSRAAILWNWGDGTITQNQATPSKTYNSPGTFNGYCKVTNPDGKSEQKSFTIVVSPKPTSSSVISNFNPPVGSGVEDYTNFKSSIALGTPQLETSILWDWGDGTKVSGGLSKDHVYSSPGVYSFKVSATYKGVTETRTAQITVTTSATVPKGEIVVTNKIYNRYFFYGNFQGTGLSFAWNFGDGKTGTGKTIDHVYSSPGSYLVLCTVTDSLGQKQSDTVTVSVSNSDVAPKEGDAVVTIVEPMKLLSYQIVNGVANYQLQSNVKTKNMRSDISINATLYIKVLTIEADNTSKTLFNTNFVISVPPSGEVIKTFTTGLLSTAESPFFVTAQLFVGSDLIADYDSQVL